MVIVFSGSNQSTAAPKPSLIALSGTKVRSPYSVYLPLLFSKAKQFKAVNGISISKAVTMDNIRLHIQTLHICILLLKL